jgi:hypothetical protein
VSTPEASPEDVQEQQAALVAEPAGLGQEDLPVEAPVADAADQHAGPEGAAEGDEELPDEAPEADVAEQRAEVGYDEDDAPIG